MAIKHFRKKGHEVDGYNTKPNEHYDAYVLYAGDKVVGVFSTREEICDLLGVKYENVRRWGQPWYKERWYQDRAKGLRIKSPYLVENVRLGEEDDPDMV